ncbi:hypothetical protein TVAG_042090 [Trichomonas vaginalis G3]|uniref:Uncharacterized protein n=1 Tax=Trichomonas vaginalis (strain ATCC PRA-98 / G3) TaxID=412133 RepID=A2EUU8_TRIV3|nr:hypothetical protein TVAGG3_0192190 [Trichomonas vaginalis G3]EAY03557.1 hypothetical protein TVAG_042090 [Trichomonas vaginalis G3]KAI5550058.1 hypothetical protein TVAGG3_0192190 [Trichomonas vaginalis G3]|eukprot:XP_001315780.1 hypothetical protein [Trichomonas vaginalis G3]
MYKLTNKDIISHKYGISTYNWMDSNGQEMVIRTLPEFQGLEGQQGSNIVRYILRNSPKVTNVDTMNYKKTSSEFISDDDRRWKNRTSWEEKPSSIDGTFAFSWQNIEIAPSSSKSLSFSIGKGDYILNYQINIKKPNKEYFAPNSPMYLLIFIPPASPDINVQIYRSIDDGKEDYIVSFTDNGNTFNYNDTFLAPDSGHHKIKYKTVASNGLNSTNEITITATVPPTIKFKAPPRDQYVAGDVLNVSVIVDDDTFVKLNIMKDSFTHTDDVICNGTPKTSIVSYPISIDEVVGSTHSVRIFAVDEFNFRSNDLNFTYTIKESSPDIELTEELKMYYPISSFLKIHGQFRNLFGPTNLCLYTELNNNTNPEKHFCEDVINASWNPFSFSYKLKLNSDSLNFLNIYCEDSRSVESNIIVHKFGIISLENCVNLYTCHSKAPPFKFYLLTYNTIYSI